MNRSCCWLALVVSMSAGCGPDADSDSLEPFYDVVSSTVLGDIALQSRVTAGPDDAEELSSGSMYLKSSDLELTRDASTQTIGLRFGGLSIPKGATIVSASVQFTADKATSESTSLLIRGVAADNASTFTLSTKNISSRPMTSASVSWQPAAWTTVGAAGSAQRSPNLAAVIQQVVSRPGWVSGNAIGLVITGTGKRVARSFEGDPTKAALLQLVYRVPDVTAPTVSITSPASGTVLSSDQTVVVAASAQDDVGVAKVEFYDGAALKGTDTSAPYSFAWPITQADNGSHAFTARAYDAAGNSKTSSPVSLTVSIGTGVNQPLLAFPGAEGFGAKSVGGRGGKVMEVTHLGNSGTGSLRACVEATGARTCVFRVGGTIELESGLSITNPKITIAGQTAPGGGITLRNKLSNTKAAITVNTSDVVIRHLRARPGPSQPLSQTLDALQILGGSNVIIDHCSFSWATDEVLSTWGAPHDVTVQWSVVSESLNKSTHGEVPGQGHGKGMLLGSSGNYNLSVHHVLLAHHDDRVPYAKTSGIIDFVNNVIFNAANRSNIGDDHSEQKLNYIGNYYKKGVNSSTEPCIRLYSKTQQCFEVFIGGNTCLSTTLATFDSGAAQYCRSAWQVTTPHPVLVPVTRTSATDAYDQVLAAAGATQGLDAQGNFFARRDAVDKRVIEEVRSGKGKIIDAPGASTCYSNLNCASYLSKADYTAFGISDPLDPDGWPVLATGAPYADSDHDGMSDDWERLHFGDLSRGSTNDSSGDLDSDGYTDLEEFLNGTDP